jgi:integrase
MSLVCQHVGVSRVKQLDRTKIADFIKKYQVVAASEGRQPDAVRVSVNSWLRNAAAMFSSHALKAYRQLGLQIENPFAGEKLRRVKIKGYSPLDRSIFDRIWNDSVLLRDGDPSAPAPTSSRRRASPDFRKPHPEAYLLLLLELGLGMRRNEADKAQWDWIFANEAGRHFLEIRATPHFVPKGKERRVIPLDKSLFEALKKHKGNSPFIVPGPSPRLYAAASSPKNLTYRCGQHHRALATWLRSRGVSDAKPCHLLRKEFGSYVATSHGLFHAQKFLGHTSPSVTADYYASLVDLPELRHGNVT